MDRSESAPRKKTIARPGPRDVQVVCPHCEANFRTPLRDEPHEVECLVCEELVPVPGREGLGRRDETAAAPRRRKAGRKSREVRPASVFDRMAETRDERYAPLSWWAFVFGVFTIPWYPEVFFRWVWLSLGCTLMGVLGLTVNWCFSMGGIFARAGYALAFPFFWISIWTCSYAAACGLSIVGDTANGADHVETWPEPHWIDWAVDLLRLLAVAAPIAAASWLVALGFGLRREELFIATGAGLYLLFPPLFLAAADAGTILALPGKRMLTSFGRVWWAWLLLYVESALLFAAWPGILILGFLYDARYQAAAVTGPLAAAVLLIYARLLGRLAWRIGQ